MDKAACRQIIEGLEKNPAKEVQINNRESCYNGINPATIEFLGSDTLSFQRHSSKVFVDIGSITHIEVRDKAVEKMAEKCEARDITEGQLQDWRDSEKAQTKGTTITERPMAKKAPVPAKAKKEDDSGLNF